MQELYFPEAIVLDREDANGFDSRYSIYAKGFGKFLAKATSARKITSKLAGHLEPGNLVKIRVVGNGNFQVVDVLKSSKIEVRCSDLYLLNQMLPEQDFEFAIWQELMNVRDDRIDRGDINDRSEGSKFSWTKVLKILGWDPEHAVCEQCGEGKVTRFKIGSQSFSCQDCFSTQMVSTRKFLSGRTSEFVTLSEA
ncbi:MAG: recombination protein O N-terminal domain-containing protein [Candidatus Liptonbacteria bacterium]|nr:recombination protein O N-terminal domain-containing protein [Candidatus Liptonbacteria bacterium]